MTRVPEKTLKEGVLELTQPSKPQIGHYANRKLSQRDDSVWFKSERKAERALLHASRSGTPSASLTQFCAQFLHTAPRLQSIRCPAVAIDPSPARAFKMNRAYPHSVQFSMKTKRQQMLLLLRVPAVSTGRVCGHPPLLF
ncbi:hypothetical protein SRHO_G00094510 [Serrasalmus rhombeus]